MSIDRHIDSVIAILYEAEEEAKLFQLESDEVRLRAIRRYAAKFLLERNQAKSAKLGAVAPSVVDRSAEPGRGYSASTIKKSDGVVEGVEARK
jgi:hypothetical protein